MEKDSTSVLFRFCVYCIALGGLIGFSSYLIQKCGNDLVIRENGIIEWGQVALLAFISILLHSASKYSQEFKELYKTLFILPVIAIIRENDRLLETYIFDKSWEVFVIIGLIYFGYVLIRTYHPVIEQFFKFTHTQSFVCFVLGFFIVCVFSRIAGQQTLWQAVLQELNHRRIGGCVEELLEFLGYCILLMGAIECYFEAKLKRK